MATASVITQVNVVRTYNLTLSQAEAEALRVALAHVGGVPEHSPRGDIDNITSAMDKALGEDYQTFTAHNLFNTGHFFFGNFHSEETGNGCPF